MGKEQTIPAKGSKFQLVGEIITLATIIANTCSTDVFVDYASHVNQIEVRVWENGWKSGTPPEKRAHYYLNKGGIERELQTCKKWLTNYLLKGEKRRYENRKNIARVSNRAGTAEQ